MATYAIKDWDGTFEDNRSREVEVLKFTKFPIRQDGESFGLLMRSAGGVLAYGVFCALVQLAARCPIRGILRDGKGDYTPERAAKRLGMSVRLMTAAWDLLASEPIGWLIAVEVPPDCRSSADAVPIECRPSAEPINLIQERIQDPKAIPNTRPLAATAPRIAAVRIGWTPAGGWSGITDPDRAAWAVAYPACSIDRQLASMAEWLKANATKAHKSNWRKFVTGWLQRSQDRGGDARTNGTVHAPRRATTAEEVAKDLGLTLEHNP